MTLRLTPLPLFWVLIAFCWVASSQATAQTRTADLGLKAQLIWGTDEQKPADKDHLKDVDPKLKEKLARVFKWKNYFLVSEKKITVPRKESRRERMSPKCEIELKFVDDATLEMRLYGEGKHTGTLRKSVKAMEQGELSVLAGDDKDKYGDAWFVVICYGKPEGK